MPKSLSDIRNYPFSQGTTQALRVLPALRDASYVKLDERQIEDFLILTQKFSSKIKYFNLNNKPEFTWTGLLPDDVSFQIALLASLDLKAYGRVWDKLSEQPEDNDHVLAMTRRFDFLYQIIYILAESYARNDSYGNYSSALLATSKSTDIGLLYELSNAYFTASNTLNLVKKTPYASFTYADIVLDKSKDLQKALLDEKYVSFLASDSEDTFDPTLIFGGAATVPERVKNALEYQNLIAEALLKTLASSVELAKEYFDSSLTDYNRHKPHVALLLAYLKVQDEFVLQYNTLLQQHTDFYYKEALLLGKKPYQADELHVYFELAKNQNPYLLPIGTKLKGGKDTLGKDVYYETAEQIIVNKSQVAAVKSFAYIAKDSPSRFNRPEGLFAAEVANSKDGKGAKLADKESWATFRTSNELIAGLGFAFVAPLMQEVKGDASYHIYITLSQVDITNLKLKEEALKDYIAVELYTEKETQVYQNIEVSVDVSGGYLKVPFTTNGLSKTKISSEGPSASVILRANSVNESNVSFLDVYELLRSAHVSRLEVELQNQVVEAFLIDTPVGPGNAKEGFFPFGPSPRVDNSFTLEVDLLKGRELIGFSFSGELKERADSTGVHVHHIMDALKSSSEVHYDIVSTKSFSFEPSFSPVSAHSGKTKFYLYYSLGHENYIKKFTLATIAKQSTDSADDALNPFPNEPYTPFFKNCTLTVTVGETVDLNKNFYNRYPFGFKLLGVEAKVFAPVIDTEGELYIGVKDAQVGESFAILFQLNEGSADPDLEAASPKWYYLSGNEWTAFEEYQLIDGTDKLTKSGIVKGSWPELANSNTLLFEEQLFWLRLTVEKGKIDAVSDIVGLHTQAVLSRFVAQPDNDPAYLGSLVEGSFITALSPKLGSIKAVQQPYPSFNGRKTELDAPYYLRVSERLRHKKRAITQWDVEHLLAQEFSEIYKTKCLIHSAKDAVHGIIAQAGSVLVVVLPYSYEQSEHKFKPKVNVAVLRKIKDYLLKRTSPFASFNVLNAEFEEITLQVECVFREHIRDKGFYHQQLIADLQAYLAPWTVSNNPNDLLFDKSIYKAAVLDFIEELDYVDYVTKLELAHGGQSNKDEATPLSPIGILTSATTHGITAFLATEV